LAFRVLALKQGTEYLLTSDGEPVTPPAGRLPVALSGFLTNLSDLYTRYGLVHKPSLSSSERLTQLIERGGVEVLTQLKGSFSVLVVCPDSRQLWARRDRLGAHSLYFARNSSATGWVVGNSAADVLRASGHSFAEDPVYMAHYFSTSAEIPEGRSPFHAISSVLPGELLTINDHTLQRRRIPVDMHQTLLPEKEEEIVPRFHDLLRSSVNHCLAAESDTGVMLSGGMDSGPVAIVADSLCEARGRRLLPISWSLKQFPEADESIWVDQIAERLSHPLVRMDGSSFLPFSQIDTSPVNPEAPGFNAFRPLIDASYTAAASHGCEVILNGNAGDELYPSYSLLYRDQIARREWRALITNLARTAQRSGPRALWHSKPLRTLLRASLRRVSASERPAPWLTANGQRNWTELEIWPPEASEHPFPEFAQQLYGRRMASGRAIEHFQVCKLGIERRDPFHNEDLVAFMLNAPFSLTYRDHRTKWLMREAMRGLLPERIRVKRRTGLLTSFYQSGWEANRAEVEAFLFTTHREWQRWVKPGVVRQILTEPSQADRSAALVDRCIGYVNWLQHWQNAWK
jgi:asparagine synthase (glutamine-hydrolysing)